MLVIFWDDTNFSAHGVYVFLCTWINRQQMTPRNVPVVEQWGHSVPPVDTLSHFAYQVAPGSSSVLFHFYFREQT